MLLVPAAVFFVVGAGAVAFVYLRRDEISILRLIVAWTLATIGTAVLVVAIISAIALVGGSAAT